MKRRALIGIGVLAVIVAAIVVLGSGNQPAQAAPSGLKGVVCHATGSAGNPYNGIIIGLGTNPDGTPNGTFSNNGHIDASGNPESGHEDDIYIGSAPPNTKDDCKKLPPPK
jgi:hypothetical protein